MIASYGGKGAPQLVCLQFPLQALRGGTVVIQSTSRSILLCAIIICEFVKLLTTSPNDRFGRAIESPCFASIFSLGSGHQCTISLKIIARLMTYILHEEQYISLRANIPLQIIICLCLQEGRPDQRNLSDSAALAAKVAKKAEMKQQQEEEAAKSAANIPVVRKKVTTKKDDDLDALLSVGLPGKKK